MKKLIFLFILFLSSFDFSKSIFAQNTPQLDWAIQIGGSGYDCTHSADVDASGNVFVTGHFEDTVDFDPGPGTALLMAHDDQDIFIAKYDASGNYLWAKCIGGEGYDYGESLKVDQSGNFYLACQIEDIVDFDPGTPVHNLSDWGGSSVIAKYTTEGNYMWAYLFPGEFVDMQTMTIDATNNLFLTGTFLGTADFDLKTGVANLTGTISDNFIAKYDSMANFVWANNIGGHNIFSMQSDPFGNIYITGDFADTTDLDPGPGVAEFISMSSLDAFIAKYYSNGEYKWAKAIGGNKIDMGYCIYTDLKGNVYWSGSFQDTVDFDPGLGNDFIIAPYSIPGSGDGDVFISKYDSAGNYYWTNELCTDSFIRSRALGENSIGQIYMIGAFSGTVDFDPGVDTVNMVGLQYWSTFVSRYNPDGSYSWSGNLAGNEFTDGNSLIIDKNDEIYICGRFLNTVDFDMDITVLNFSSNGDHDIFITKYSMSIKTTTLPAVQKVNSFSIFPNPTSGNFQISFPTSFQDNTLLSISNLLGQKLFEQKPALQTSLESFNFSTWQKGIYIVSLQSENGTKVKRLVIQ